MVSSCNWLCDVRKDASQFAQLGHLFLNGLGNWVQENSSGGGHLRQPQAKLQYYCNTLKLLIIATL